MKVISVKNLNKSYGDNEVLKGISFDVERGEVFAVLGINGAGKTTLLECIEGLKDYNGGSISIMGLDNKELSNTKKIGVQLQSSSLPKLLKVKEILKLFGIWSDSNLIEDVINTFELDELLEKKYNELSTGQKRKVHLALALINDPEVIFLDEPTAGLDVQSRAKLHKEIRLLKSKGKTIIIASHDMAEIESLCDSLIMIKNGKIVFDGPLDKFVNSKRKDYRVSIKSSENDAYDTYEFTDLHTGLGELLKKYDKVYDLIIERSKLEDIFLDIAKEGSKDVV